MKVFSRTLKVRGGIISQANRYLGSFCSSQRIFPPQIIQVLLFIFICAFDLALGSLAHAAPACSPKNYTKIKNTEPMPDDFCAYAYLPYRARMPEHPRHIDQTNTKILQQEYAPNSKPNDPHTNQMYTLGRRPTRSNEGNSNYPVFIAGPNDPLVSVNCAMSNYGCSDADSNSRHSIPSFRVPAWARPSGQFDEWDANMEIIQPNGDTVSLYQCRPQRDWRNGDVVGDSSSICGRFGGASYGNIVTSSGVNPGNVNGGNNFAALPVHYREVMNGQINHALLVWAGCFTGAVYPAKWQALSCKNPPGIPSGAHIWLSLTRQQIDALPASVVPVHMRPFAYAAHEYGIYTMDTGNGKKWFGQPALEDSLPYVLSGGGTESYWAGWFKQHGGGMSGDANLKMSGRGNIIDWSALAPYLYVLDPCYAKGTCSDSVPEGAVSQPEPPPATYKVQVAWEYPPGIDARQVVTEVFHAGSVVATSAAGGLMASFETTATGKYCVTARARQGERTGDHSPEACVDINPPMQALPVLLNLKVILP